MKINDYNLDTDTLASTGVHSNGAHKRFKDDRLQKSEKIKERDRRVGDEIIPGQRMHQLYLK